MKFRGSILLTALLFVTVAVSAFAGGQFGIDHMVGDIQLYNNNPNSDYGTAIAEEPTIRLDGSTGLIDFGAGDTTATSVSAGFVAADRFGIGASDCYSLEGATANAFELSLCATDPTADNTATLPIMSAASYAVMGSTLTTNSAEIANSVWGTSNGLHLEGATADDFEAIFTTADVAQDVTVTVPDAGSGVLTLGDVTIHHAFGATIADHLDTNVFVADRAYVLTSVNATWGALEVTGAMDIMVEKLVGVTACGSGTDMLSAAIDATATADTTTAGTLHGTAANLAIAAGDTICIDLSATPSEIANMVVTLSLEIN